MPSQGSQDLDPRFSVFLNPIRDLTKNWEVDIAKYLEDYLHELSEIQITFDGGKTVMDFAQAAMLIQGSATVYSKKVEFLWQMVLQMLDLLSSKRTLEKEGADAGGETGPGGKGPKHQGGPVTVGFQKVTMSESKNINMKEEEEEGERREQFKFLPGTPLHLVEKESEKSSARVILFLKNLETFGNKDDFRINRSYLTPAGVLCLNLPEEILRKNLKATQISSGEGIMNCSIAGFMLEDPLPLQGVGVAPSTEECPPEEMDHLDPGIPADDGVDHGGGMDEADESLGTPEHGDQELPPRGDMEELPLVPPPGGQKKEEDLVEMKPVNGRIGMKKRGAKDIVAELKLSDPLKPLDPHLETPARRPIRAGRIRKPIPCNCHKEQFTKKNSRAKKESPRKEEKDPIVPIETMILQDLADLVLGMPKEGFDPRLAEELSREEKRRQAALKAKKLAHLPRGGEELQDPPLDVPSNDEDEGIPDIDFDNFGAPFEGFDLPDPHAVGDSPIVTPYGPITSEGAWGEKAPALNDSLLYEPSSDYEALVQKWVLDVLSNAQEHVSSSDLTRRVNQWRKRITPKLQQEEERRAFDIHQYGTRANSYNVEVSQTVDGDLEMDCLQLRLLSRVRQHQELEEYIPPSQQLQGPLLSVQPQNLPHFSPPHRKSGRGLIRKKTNNNKNNNRKRKKAASESSNSSFSAASTSSSSASDLDTSRTKSPAYRGRSPVHSSSSEEDYDVMEAPPTLIRPPPDDKVLRESKRCCSDKNATTKASKKRKKLMIENG